MPRKSGVTIRDIAVAARVSHTAAWATLSGRKSNVSVSEKMRKHIQSVAQEMNYKPDILAKSFTNKKSYLIGFLAYKTNDAIGMEVIEGIQLASHPRDYAVVTFVNETVESESCNLQLCLDRHIDALVTNLAVSGHKNNADAFVELISKDIPVVEIFGNFIPDAVRVNIDHKNNGEIATRHLIELGHKRIVHFTHDNYDNQVLAGHHDDSRLMWEGYRDTMLANGLEPTVFTHPLDANMPILYQLFDMARQLAKELLNHVSKPTGIVCYSDFEAFALCSAFNAMGINVPRDMSIVGAVDIATARMSVPPLTTVRYNSKKVGMVAADYCFRLMEGKKVENQLIKSELIVRDSTCPPRS